MLAKAMILVSMALPLMGQAISDQAAEHASAARAAESRNDFPTAVREYRTLAKLLPRSAEVQSNLGVALYFNHDMAGAAEASQRAIALNPNLFAPHLFSGLAWYKLSNPNRAVPELERAVHLNGSDILAHLWLGYAYVAQLRYEAAAKEFQTVCHLDPGNIDAWYALGQSYIQVGKDTTVRLIAVAPNGGRIWQLAGMQYLLRGDHEKALEYFQEAIKRRPDIKELPGLIAAAGGAAANSQVVGTVADAGHEKEDALFQQAHDAEQMAHEAFERVMQIAPDSYRAHQIAADVLVAKQQPQQAIQEYREVLKLKPDLPGVHEAIGNILEEQGKLTEALQEFKAELQIQPDSSDAHMHAGQVLLTMGNDAEAGKMLNGALVLDRPSPDVYRLAGKLDLNRKEYGAAVDMLTRYVAIRKDDSTAYYMLSKAYRALGDKEKMGRALAMFERTSQDVKARNRAQLDLDPSAATAAGQGEQVDQSKTAAH